MPTPYAYSLHSLGVSSAHCRLLYLTAHVALPDLADPHAKHSQLHILRRGGKPPPCQAEDISLRLDHGIVLTARHLPHHSRHSG